MLQTLIWHLSTGADGRSRPRAARQGHSARAAARRAGRRARPVVRRVVDGWRVYRAPGRLRRRDEPLSRPVPSRAGGRGRRGCARRGGPSRPGRMCQLARSSLAGRARARIVHEHQMFVLETVEEYGCRTRSRRYASVRAASRDLRAHGQLRRRCRRRATGAGAVDLPRPAPLLLRVRVLRVDLDHDIETIAPRPTAASDPPRW